MERDDDDEKEEARATLVTLRNLMDKISGTLYEAKSDLQYIAYAKRTDEKDAKEEDRDLPTLESLQIQLKELFTVAHDCQVCASDIRS